MLDLIDFWNSVYNGFEMKHMFYIVVPTWLFFFIKAELQTRWQIKRLFDRNESLVNEIKRRDVVLRKAGLLQEIVRNDVDGNKPSCKDNKEGVE